VAELLERARQLVAGGPHVTHVSELIAVHALIYPNRDPVCDHCPAEQGRAYYAIKRWVTQQENSSPTIFSDNVKQHSIARFHSDQLIYTPHGLGVAYSNDNLTDKAARDILKADPDAAQHFAVLPPLAEGEDEQPLTPAQQNAEKQAEQAQHPASPVPQGIDYAKLAAALLDEQERRAGTPPAPAPAPEQPTLTASASGAAEADAKPEVKKEELDNGVEVTTGTTEAVDQDHDEKPVRLSRMNKDQLVATYRAELNLEPLADLTNDQLRDAIAEHRAGQADAE